jgi:uncharacterized membrane-anchored protein YjiN (DUF445 family)
MPAGIFSAGILFIAAGMVPGGLADWLVNAKIFRQPGWLTPRCSCLQHSDR